MLFATLDFEASSLTGWPIEAGWIREYDTAPRSMLIRPDPMWSMREWDAKAEAVHKIPIEALRCDGVDAAAVFLELTRELAGCVVVSDATIYDSWWLGRLADACRQDRPFRLWSINDAIPALAARAGVSVGTAVKRYVENAPNNDALHRAGSDAERLLRRLLSIRSKKSGRRAKNADA